MNRFSLTHLLDGEVLRGLKSHLAKERDALADVLAHIAEVETRKLFVPAGYESMHDYCVRGLHLSKDCAYKRITAARAALDHPAIFERVAEGAIGLAVVSVLAPYLTPENAGELLAGASFKTREEVQALLATRFPREAVPTTIEPVAQPLTLGATPETTGESTSELAPGRVQEVVNPHQITPLASDLYKLQLTMTGAMFAKLRRAAELFGRRKPVPDEAEILELGLDLLVQRLEKKKFHATDRPRPRRPCAEDHIPAEVKRTVYVRDGGQCTFHSEDGTRCAAKKDLQYDHIIPEARGGRSDDKDNLRLRCHAHNQYEAERAFGKQFMEGKRERAAAGRARRKTMKAAEREQAAAAAERGADTLAVAFAECDDDPAAAQVVEQLEALGYTEEEGRLAASMCRPPAWVAPETRRLMCLEFLRQRDGDRPDSMVSPAVIPAQVPCRTGMDDPALPSMRDPWTCGPALDPMAPGAW